MLPVREGFAARVSRRLPAGADAPLRRALVVAALAALVGCATPVGVDREDVREVYRTNSESVLSTDGASVASRQVLLRLGLFGRFEDRPEEVLAELHTLTVQEMAPARLFALAEYAELHAEHSGSRPYHVAAALYAWAYLFPDDGADAPDPLDPRFRLAAALYNRALAAALAREGEVVGPQELNLPPHVGSLQVRFDPAELAWAGRRLTDFVPAANLAVRGLRSRYTHTGLGATFAARAEVPEGGGLEPRDALVAERMRLPLAVLLRFEAPRAGLREGASRARLEVYDALDDDVVAIAGRQVPLEFETSAALALTLDDAPVWDTEIAGFRNPARLREGARLRTWGRHRRGRIPVVFVHGTASSPARWAEMLNELSSDPAIRRRYEFWFFTYPTGQPILYSASQLREALRDAVAILDPEGTDPGLSRMVLVGHSQGGLLCKLQVVESGSRFWDAITDLPFDELELEPGEKELLRESLFFEPLPFVERVIFVSTPHRGSFLAGNWLGRIAAGITTSPQILLGLPVDLARAGVALPGAAVGAARDGVDTLQGDEEAKLLRELERVPSSVDNMNPNHRFTRTVASIPVEPPVVAHSIIPVKGGPPPQGRNDGVVAYTSAHLDEAESERVVFHSGHSVQSDPRAVQEVRRILLEHLGAGASPEAAVER